MSEPLVFTIILSWNQRDVTLASTATAGASDYRRHRLVVVDNGSTDGSADAVRSVHPGAVVLETGQNLGYAGGNNVGLRYALAEGADYVLLLNNDAFLADDAIERLVRVLEELPWAAAAGPTIVYDDRPERVWCAGAGISLHDGSTWRLGDGETPRADGTPEEVSLLSGCALMLRRAALEQVGLLDERYFLYYEEADWCVRASTAGWKLLWVPGARVRHRVAASTEAGDGLPVAPQVTYYMTRNRLLLLASNLRGPARWVACGRAMGDILRLIAVRSLKGQWQDRDARAGALRYFLAGRFGRSSP